MSPPGTTARQLRRDPFQASHVLVTGANGYLGALVVASLLRDCAARITCLTRPQCSEADLLTAIAEEWEAQSHGRWSSVVQARIRHLSLPEDLADVADLAPRLAGVDSIVHCAGCLDYHDVAQLQAVNVDYTAHLLLLARRLDVRRFVYLSSAYSSGYQAHPTPEAPLAEPVRDPTPYTRTKREAERLVAACGLPFIVLRPSILIGTSDTGRYSGKRYGLYQQWMGLERLVCDRYHAEFHAVAPEVPLNLLHQDAFCSAFKAAFRWLPDSAFMNIVSGPADAPTMRDLWDLWFDVTRPATIHYYPTLGDVPLKAIHARQRACLIFAHINLEIASHRWAFETGWLDLLRRGGLPFASATIASVARCQRRFVESSVVLARYAAAFADRLTVRPRVVEAGNGFDAQCAGLVESHH
ncbi:MAG TPA: SDR family oxidoreductase [Chloroflexota bacterium]|nr:SDR family oxidoreductase [Chloroflexota bacterium]